MNSCFISSLEIASIFVTFDFHFSPRQSLNAYIADINDDFQKYYVLKKCLKRYRCFFFIVLSVSSHMSTKAASHIGAWILKTA